MTPQPERTIRLNCKICRASVDTGLNLAMAAAILARKEPIQVIAPKLSKEIREMFLSGICPKCWIALFETEES